jgi:hypothetical protein
MKRLVLAMAVVAGTVLASASSWAATIVTVPLGAIPGVPNPYTDEQKGNQASGDIDYTFSIGSVTQVVIQSGGPVSGLSGPNTTGLSALSLQLLDSGNNVIGSASSVALFGQRITGLTDLLNPGSYTLKIFFTKAVSKQLFDITTTITANVASPTPVPAAGLLLLTAIGGLGGLSFWRKRRSNAA